MLKTEQTNIEDLLRLSGQSSDFRTITIGGANRQVCLSFFNTLIDQRLLQEHVLQPLKQISSVALESLGNLIEWIPIDDIQITDQIDVIQSKLFKGSILVRLHESDSNCALIQLSDKRGMRSNNDTENEFSVVGPKVGFVEDLDTNLSLLRAQINIPNLIIKEITMGSVSKTKVAIVFIEGVTNEQNVQTIEQRLRSIDCDVVFDSSELDQIISDNSFSPFPLFVSTERRDRVVYALISGQVAVISDGSPYFITGPSTLFDFFISPEDYYMPWILGSFFRIIRIFGVVFSLFATSMYVAVTTFHYEVIPHNLLSPLLFSRLNVPFPPVLEVLFLEITIEFLREAGARLPTKIGQTLGIVGGIVVGQAAVEAGLTSNILIIIVSLSALASFATPIYKMSNTIRFLRFPIILLSAVWGAIGMFIGVCFLIVHITRLKSLGSPYTVPLYPLRIQDFQDSFIRSSFQYTENRPGYLKSKSRQRYKAKPVKRRFEWDEP